MVKLNDLGSFWFYSDGHYQVFAKWDVDGWEYRITEPCGDDMNKTISQGKYRYMKSLESFASSFIDRQYMYRIKGGGSDL